MPADADRKRPEFARVAEALECALAEAPLETVDAALVDLARNYARIIDAAPVAAIVEKRLGREFLDVLAALGLTPAARKAVARPVPGPSASGAALAELRARRERGA